MKRFRNTLWLACSIVVIVFFTPLATAQAAATWTVVPSLNVAELNVLNSTAWKQWTAEGWAVGSSQNIGAAPQALTENWKGGAWVPQPNPSIGYGAALNSVVSIADKPDFWSVGYWINSSGVKQTLTELLTSEQWILIPSPNVGEGDNVLNSVVWDPTTDTGWAVGYSTNNLGTRQTLIEQWTGSAWIVVPSPSMPPGDNVLNGVAVNQNTGQANAVGYWHDTSGLSHTLSELWTGSSWQITTSPNRGPTNVLTSIAWIPFSNSFWVAGYFVSSVSAPQQTFIMQWTGNAWAIVPSPNLGPSDNALTSVAALNPQVAWVVGSWRDPSSGTLLTLTEQWTGSQWTIIPSPNVGSGNNVLNGVIYSSQNQSAVAVGYSGSSTLAEQS